MLKKIEADHEKLILDRDILRKTAPIFGPGLAQKADAGIPKFTYLLGAAIVSIGLGVFCSFLYEALLSVRTRVKQMVQAEAARK